MQDESKQFPDGEPATERIIVLELLRKDRSEWWPRAEVLSKLDDIDPDAVRGSLGHLARRGVLVADGERVRVADSVRHIDALHLICI